MAATGASAASARRDSARLAETGVAERVHGGLQAIAGRSRAERRAGAGDPLLRQSLDPQYRRQARHRQARGRDVRGRRRRHRQRRHDDLSDGANSCAERRLKILTNSYPLAEFSDPRAEIRVALPGGEVYRDQKLIVVAVRRRRDPALFGRASCS